MQTTYELVVIAADRNVDPARRHTAFEALVRQFQDMAYGCAYGILGDFHLAQDVSQDAFLTAYKDLDKLRDAAAFPGWFKQIVMRKAYRLSKVYGLLPEPIEADTDFFIDGLNQEEQIEAKEEQALVHGAIEALPEHERTVTALFYLTGYSQKKTAEFLDLPLATVKKRLQRSRERLKERMIKMVKDTFEDHRPSKNNQFASDVVEIIGATEAGDLSKLAALLARNPGLVDANAPLSDSYPIQAKGWKPLHIAAWHGHKKAVEFLIEQGADINARCEGNRMPLHYAIEAGSRETQQLLLERGAEIDINIASILGMTERVQEMLVKDPSLANDNSTFLSPLGWAAFGGQIEVARMLIEYESSIPVETIFIPISTGNVEFLLFLLDNGANLGVRKKGRREDGHQFDKAILHAAVEMPFTTDNAAVLELLIARGADVNALDESGNTPLDLALERGADAPYTVNPHETPNEKKDFDKIIATLQEHGGKTSEEFAAVV